MALSALAESCLSEARPRCARLLTDVEAAAAGEMPLLQFGTDAQGEWARSPGRGGRLQALLFRFSLFLHASSDRTLLGTTFFLRRGVRSDLSGHLCLCFLVVMFCFDWTTSVWLVMVFRFVPRCVALCRDRRRGCAIIPGEVFQITGELNRGAVKVLPGFTELARTTKKRFLFAFSLLRV